MDDPFKGLLRSLLSMKGVVVQLAEDESMQCCRGFEFQGASQAFHH